MCEYMYKYMCNRVCDVQENQKGRMKQENKVQQPQYQSNVFEYSYQYQFTISDLFVISDFADL